MLPLAGKLLLAQMHQLQKGTGNGLRLMCRAKANTGSEKLMIKILPYSPDISYPTSVHLNVYTNSCNCMLNKLNLKQDVQAQSKYLSMEAFMPPT